MPTALETNLVAEVVRLALLGHDHRDVMVRFIDRQFLQQSIDFFGEVVRAKLKQREISTDWYRDHLIDSSKDTAEIAWSSGINLKTVSNKHGSQRRELVLSEAANHLSDFRQLVDSLMEESMNIELRLTFNDVSVTLDLNESLVVINALAVRRMGMRGGAWSAMGKRVEEPLMVALCRFFRVPETHYTRRTEASTGREVDFFLLRDEGAPVKCEVKLMGRGNPESADATAARNTNVFVASTLSSSVKRKLDEDNVMWTELQSPNGLLRFRQTLGAYAIPFVDVDASDISAQVERAIDETFGHR